MNNILAAIYSNMLETEVYDRVGGRIYLDQAPDGTEFPYIVYFIVTGNPDNTFSEKMESIILQFSIFSLQSGPTEIIGIYYYLKTLFDDCDLTISRGEGTDNVLIWCKRQNLTTMVDEVTTPSGTATVKHWAIDYSILVRTD